MYIKHVQKHFVIEQISEHAFATEYYYLWKIFLVFFSEFIPKFNTVHPKLQPSLMQSHPVLFSLRSDAVSAATERLSSETEQTV